MEIESDNGDKIHLKPNVPIFIGRDTNIHTNDRTVSRHKHISLELHNSKNPRVSFEAMGKNPVWVRKSGGGGEIRVYRKGERGELRSNDAFSISSKEHIWFRVMESKAGERVKEDEDIEEVEDLEFDGGDIAEFDGGDIAEIDPVKEFGFLVMGHEFDSYSKQMIRDIKKWNWFLEEPKKGSEDDDDDDAAKQRRKGRGRKRKGKHDDEWEGESEEDKELISKTQKVPRPTYSTRSKDGGKSTNGRTEKSKAQASKSASKDEIGNGDDSEDEDDETLGGFIVDNEEEMEDPISDTGEEDEEEEEFEDDEDLD